MISEANISVNPNMIGGVAIEQMRPIDWAQVKAIHLEGIATGHATFETDAPSWEVWDEAHLRFARLVTHYWRHAAFVADDQLLRDAPALDGIPGVLIHGRYDVSSPLETAWRLSQRWATSRLHVLDDAGHGGGDTFLAAVVGALNQFAAK